MSFITSIPSPSVSYFDVGPLRIHIYALCILVGIIAATWMTDSRLTRRGGERGVTLDIILWAVPLGLIGARFYHVFTHPNDYFYANADLLRVFYIWEGGNAIFGALLGGALGAWIGCKTTGIRFWSFADALAPAMLLAQGIGRLGNYFNQELFGQPTDAPWGLEIAYGNPAWPTGLPEGTLFQPMFLYEMIWNFAGIIVILFAERVFYLRWGKAFGVYLVWYGLGRMYFENIRLDPSESFLSVRTNVWAAIFALVVGILLIVIQQRRHPGQEFSVYREGGPEVKLEASTRSSATSGKVSE